MYNRNTEVLRNLLDVAIESKSLWVAAVGYAENRVLKTGFWRMADARNELIDRLARHLPAHGNNPPHVDVTVESLHGMYAELLESFRRHLDPEARDARLREYEARFLDCFDRALETLESPEIRDALREQMLKVRASDRELKGMSDSLAA